MALVVDTGTTNDNKVCAFVGVGGVGSSISVVLACWSRKTEKSATFCVATDYRVSAKPLSHTCA